MLKEATHSDAEQIAQLVNKAYRPEPSERGWTHESELVAGRRINTEQVASLMSKKGSVLVAYEGNELLGCVHIERAHPYCHIGMLATIPSLQNKGLGKKLLAAAENLAISRYGAQGFKMSVLSSRPELLAYYERRGYRLTGSTQPYPAEAGVGQPLNANLHVLELIKPYHAPGCGNA
ncbi:MAG: GNAT family N-acetyltransferase [Aquabacterium sp.]|nr:GNAT family N-acetyltransferase [Aquabacterium sp.]